MSLQTSGAISLTDIQNEFYAWNSGTNPIGLNEYYGANGYSPSSGEISIGNFYGRTGFNYYSMIFGEQYGSSDISGTETYTGPLIGTRNGIGDNINFYIQCIPGYKGAPYYIYGTSTLYYYYDEYLLASFASSGSTPYAAYWLFSPPFSGLSVQFESTISEQRDSSPLGSCSITWDTAQYAPSYRTLYYHNFDYYTA